MTETSATSASAVRKVLQPTWIDFEVTRENGKDHLVKEGVPLTLIENALTTGVPPKLDVETVGVNPPVALWLVRAFDEEADRRAASPRELTHKLAIFIFQDRLVTAHRFSSDKLATCAVGGRDETLIALLDRAVKTYSDAIVRNEETFDSFEASVFGAKGAKPFKLKEAYFLKRRLTVIRKMLALTLETIDAAPSIPLIAKVPLRATRRRYVTTLSACEALLEQVNHLLQLQVAFVSQKTNEASQRTNEVMRVLTVFSAFFLPLSFIAGVYGMNFQNMPELTHHYGYATTLAFMGFVALVIWVWFWRKGWIGNRTNR